MGLLGWLLGRTEAAHFAAGRGWTTEVVGESHYQGNLQLLYRSHGGTEHDMKAIAALVPEKNNKRDSNAVRVEIERRQVGYLSRQMAAEYRASIGTAPGQCSAKIVGGFSMDDGTTAHFGVKLNMSWPPRFKS
jgi:hypothetical protein